MEREMVGSDIATRFREAVLAGDLEELESLLDEAVVFRSPAVHRPYEGRVATMVVLRAVARVFEDFRYTREFSGDDGHVLEFACRVGEREVQGADFLRFGSDRQVVELTVMIRPLSGLQSVVERMGEVIPSVMAEMGLA
jgi:hypothetical protein